MLLCPKCQDGTQRFYIQRQMTETVVIECDGGGTYEVYPDPNAQWIWLTVRCAACYTVVAEHEAREAFRASQEESS